MQGAAKVEKDSEDPTAEGVNPRPAKRPSKVKNS